SRLRTSLVAAAALFAFTTPAPAQVLVFSVKSLNDVKKDVVHVLSQLGPKEQAERMWEAFLSGATSRKGLAGLHFDRPLGLYALGAPLPDGDKPPPMVAFVPVKSEKSFLDWLKTFDIEPRRSEDGLYRVAMPGGPPTCFRFAGGHV